MLKVHAVGTWIVRAMILCRLKKSKWQQGYPPSRVRQRRARERREGENKL